MTEDEEILCSGCENKIKEDDDFCTNCGTLFSENIFCINHSSEAADGVCVICCSPFCSKCGTFYNGIFLCESHSEFEIYEGMARVFGSNDEVNVQYILDCLTKNEIHAVLFSRKPTNWYMGGAGYTLFVPAGEYRGKIINEIKVMVPCQQALEAEKILKELNISEKS
jgi:hypothetical protein